MKKTLLSVLAGLTVIGSASALPTPEDRKAMCEKHPDKYVWVEKTQACIPINPCASKLGWDDPTVMQTYCANFFGNFGEKQKLVHQRYIEQVLKTKISETMPRMFVSDSYGDFIDAYKLQDGGYIAFNGKSDDTDDDMVTAVCFAHGHGTTGVNDFRGCLGDFTQAQCTDMADFMTLLSDKLCEGTLDTYSCIFYCKE